MAAWQRRGDAEEVTIQWLCTNHAYPIQAHAYPLN
jgi:hypothetical protein